MHAIMQRPSLKVYQSKTYSSTHVSPSQEVQLYVYLLYQYACTVEAITYIERSIFFP